MAALITTTVLSVAAASGTVADHRPPSVERSAFSVCVGHRESHDNPKAVSASGKHRGRYQMTPDMARGATWMILPWLRSWHPRPARYAAHLRSIPANRWPARVQDAAFQVISEWDGDNWRHWFLAGSKCNHLGQALR